MKKFRKLTGYILCAVMMLSLIPAGVFAEKSAKPVYVSLGDSIAWGRVDLEEGNPDYPYDKEKESYRGLLAEYWGAEVYNYARRGMQTTDVLYLVDEAFREKVDKGEITVDSWYPEEYPPHDQDHPEATLEQIKNKITEADYITLCLADCDYFGYPMYVRDSAMSEIADPAAIREELCNLLKEGKLNSETFCLFGRLLRAYGDKGSVICSFILDVLKGYSDYQEYYPRIVKALRAQNETAAIALLGVYLPGETFSFLRENESSGKLVRFVNSLLDTVNIMIQKTAAEYGCYYVDTMGIESSFHPTEKGYRQIADRILSVLSGDHTYAGNLYCVMTQSDKIQNVLDALFLRKPSATVGKRVKNLYGL